MLALYRYKLLVIDDIGVVDMEKWYVMGGMGIVVSFTLILGRPNMCLLYRLVALSHLCVDRVPNCLSCHHRPILV